MSAQPRQGEWEYQWTRLEDRAEWLFADWILPNKVADWKGKTVLDAGCGPGHHSRVAARTAKRVLGLDLNTSALAKGRLGDLPNFEARDGDIATFDDGERFDVVYCVGVAHHTADPDKTVAHLKTLLKPGGRLILWVYAAEGNWINEHLLEAAKSIVVKRLPRPVVEVLGHALTLALYPLVYTVYLMPLRFLPFYEYFGNWRRLSYGRNYLNVFDKLNAPTTHFITRARAERWLDGLTDTHVSPYMGVSWRVSGTKP